MRASRSASTFSVPGKAVLPEARGSTLAPRRVLSNRVSRLGEAIPSTTVVLFDQINFLRLDLKDYERKAMVKLIRGLGPRDRVAIYALGRNLHVLQEFTDDPAKLLGAVKHLDSGRDLMPANVHDALFDFPTDMTGQIEGLGLPGLADPLTAAVCAEVLDPEQRGDKRPSERGE